MTCVFRWSAYRFERDSYHGDALPTELKGAIFGCRGAVMASRREHSARLRVVLPVSVALRPGAAFGGRGKGGTRPEGLVDRELTRLS